MAALQFGQCGLEQSRENYREGFELRSLDSAALRSG
jgi:hypothetical protein